MSSELITVTSNCCRFGDETFSSLGIISLPLATPNGVIPIMIHFDVVQADVPALLGMDILDREQLVADTVFNRLARRAAIKDKDSRTVYVADWFIPLVRSDIGHVFRAIDQDRPSLSTPQIIGSLSRHQNWT